MQAWLRFFRIVNLPTVPGDVLAGVAAHFWSMVYFWVSTDSFGFRWLSIVAACLAACAIYLFGLADNDIVGAKKDGTVRPIPAGEISLRAAKIARGVCLLVALLVGAVANLPPCWWLVAGLLVGCCVLYNRKKWCLAMGLCRGLNVVCGGAVLAVGSWLQVPIKAWLALGITAVVWTLYIAVVTKISEDEAKNPKKRRLVGTLIGALVYLQLGALLFFFLKLPCLELRNLVFAGLAMLLLLRILKRKFPKVSAS